MSASRLQTAIVTALVAASLLADPALASGLSSAFTYQGQLTQTGTPITGSCDLQFSLFDAATSGTQLGSTQTLSTVSVANGLFTVLLNDSAQFGTSSFSGSDRWLQIAVRCPAGSGSYSTLSSRQQLTAAPYALYAPTAGSADGLNCSGCVTSGDLAAGAVTGSTIASGTIQQNNLGFTPGTVTSITTGTGLSGGTITTTGTINNTGVLSVAASPPLAVSGGQNPTVSLTMPLGVANGGTGGVTAAAARSNLGAAASGANADITALLGFTGSNVALGGGALTSNTTGTYNTALGASALDSNATGSDNTALGGFALSDNTTGSENTALGVDALRKNTTVFDVTKCTGSGVPNNCCSGVGTGSCAGSNNTAVGSGALGVNTRGSNNTALGLDALANNTTGDMNTALGADALGNNTRGANNIAVGRSAGVDLSTGSNDIDIGNAGVAGESNVIRIGTSGTQMATFIAGISNATSSGGVAVLINSNGRLGTLPSSARFKEDIQDMGDSTGKLMQLRPVRFRYKKDIDPSGLEQYGLVAEEVAKVYPNLVVYDDTGQPQAVRYHFVNAMLLNEVQKQERRIESQAETIKAQAAQIEQLSAQAQQIENLNARLVKLEAAQRQQRGETSYKTAASLRKTTPRPESTSEREGAGAITGFFQLHRETDMSTSTGAM